MRETIRLSRLIPLALRAAIELARARLALARIKPVDVLRRNERASGLAPVSPSSDQRARDDRLCEEMAFAIAGMARRVPWRSDCLVQAVAGQNWLMSKRVASEIVVGTARGPGSRLDAHAWLARGGKVLLGGDIERFETLLAAGSPLPDQSKT